MSATESDHAGPRPARALRVHVLQHVPFEGPAAIAEWATERGCALSTTRVYNEPPPELESFDLLVVMGGPMNVYQEAEYPWLSAEKALLTAALTAGKGVLGVCLGGQLLSVVLGGEVTRGEQREIGWFPVELTAEGRDSDLLADFPAMFTALHWHGDTFSIPEGAAHLASSAACHNQAFSYDEGRVVGLQFHLEETRESLSLLCEHGAHELVPAKWTQTADDLLAPDATFAAGRNLLFTLMDRLAAPCRRPAMRERARSMDGDA